MHESPRPYRRGIFTFQSTPFYLLCIILYCNNSKNRELWNGIHFKNRGFSTWRFALLAPLISNTKTPVFPLATSCDWAIRPTPFLFALMPRLYRRGVFAELKTVALL